MDLKLLFCTQDSKTIEYQRNQVFLIQKISYVKRNEKKKSQIYYESFIIINI